MGKSTTGPDWEDCHMYLEAIRETHRCATTILLEPVSCGVGWSYHLIALSNANDHALGVPTWSKVTQISYPARQYATFEGALFDLLHKHDHHLAAAYTQQELGGV